MGPCPDGDMTQGASDRPVIVWFRDDLRLSDHVALSEAAQTGAALICLYVLDETSKGVRPLGGASRWWLAQSLRAMQARLSEMKQGLVLRRGAAADVITALAKEANADAVFWLHSDIAEQAAIESDLAQRLDGIGIAANSLPSDLLAKPSSIRNKDGRGLRVFTPFWKRVLATGDPGQPLTAPKQLPPPYAVASDDLATWHLEPTHPDWAGGLRDTWTPGELSAQARIKEFLAHDINGYATLRDRPDNDVTSRLSPHLRFGEISPRQVWYAANFVAAKKPALNKDIGKFISELGWREFSRHLLHDLPDLAQRNLQPSFDAFPWKRDKKAFRAWQKGLTGYPIVDAGMRQLWHTGIMHNRVRMVVASFLVKHLLIDWREGEKWFWDTLVDADPGSNPASWQWVAGSGADAAPYFRVFNPILQGLKFDPDGAYVSKWVPELKALPPELIHKPWEATPMELKEAGVTLGKTYPEPIVEHAMARERALAAYKTTRAA